MARSDFWTDSQRNAWAWVTSGEAQGMTQTQALRAYREAGGHIRTQDWGELWHRKEEASATWETLRYYKPEDTIPESMYQEVGLNYRDKYNIVFRANIRMEDGSILHGEYRTIRSNVRLTLGEIKQAIEDSLRAYAGDYGIDVFSVSDLQFYTPR
jgi:hypothetical protein